MAMHIKYLRRDFAKMSPKMYLSLYCQRCNLPDPEFVVTELNEAGRYYLASIKYVCMHATCTLMMRLDRMNGKTYTSTNASLGKKDAEHITALVFLKSANLFVKLLSGSELSHLLKSQ